MRVSPAGAVGPVSAVGPVGAVRAVRAVRGFSRFLEAPTQSTATTPQVPWWVLMVSEAIRGAICMRRLALVFVIKPARGSD